MSMRSEGMLHEDEAAVVCAISAWAQTYTHPSL